MKHTRAGFTLVELLSVIAIVAVLAGITLAGIARARAAANNTACLGNLRVIGTALLQFAADNRGRIMQRNYHPNGAETPSDAPQWHRWLIRRGYVAPTDYLVSPVFYCPGLTPTSPTDTVTLTGGVHHGFYRYGMRNWVPPGYTLDDVTLLPLNSIDNPSDFFLVADSFSTYSGGITQGYSIPQGSTGWGVNLTHGGRANTLFADGHVAAKDRAYFSDLHQRQTYGGHTNGRPFHVLPAP